MKTMSIAMALRPSSAGNFGVPDAVCDVDTMPKTGSVIDSHNVFTECSSGVLDFCIKVV